MVPSTSRKTALFVQVGFGRRGMGCNRPRRSLHPTEAVRRTRSIAEGRLGEQVGVLLGRSFSSVGSAIFIAGQNRCAMLIRASAILVCSQRQRTGSPNNEQHRSPQPARHALDRYCRARSAAHLIDPRRQQLDHSSMLPPRCRDSSGRILVACRLDQLRLTRP